MGKGWRGKKRTGKGKKIARDPLNEQIKKIGGNGSQKVGESPQE